MILIALLSFWLWTPDINQEKLDARYLNAPADRMMVSGTMLHVRDSGPKDAPAIVFLHGFASSLHTWEFWAKDLEKDYRVIRLDLPGSGLSPADTTGDYTDTRSLQLVLALIDQLGLAKVDLVGHSIGGRIAWTFAARHPQRVNKLVLIAPDGFASPGFTYGQPPQVGASLKAMRYVLPKALLRMSLLPAYAKPESLSDALLVRYHDLMLAPGGREALLARMSQTTLIDPVPLLKSITAPTLLLWGDKDAMIPVANAQNYLDALANSRLVTIPDTGHLPMEESAEIALKALRAFL